MRTPASGMRTDAAAAASECTTMSTSLCPYITALMPGDRKDIRRMLNQFFGSLPTVAEAFPLRTWQRGPYKGLPKLPPAVRSLVDDGLMCLDASPAIPPALLHGNRDHRLPPDGGQSRRTINDVGH